jgi:hypothetical protein
MAPGRSARGGGTRGGRTEAASGRGPGQDGGTGMAGGRGRGGAGAAMGTAGARSTVSLLR